MNKFSNILRAAIFAVLTTILATASINAQMTIENFKKVDDKNVLSFTVKNASRQSYSAARVTVYALPPAGRLLPGGGDSRFICFLSYFNDGNKSCAGKIVDIKFYRIEEWNKTYILSKTNWAERSKNISLDANSAVDVGFAFPKARDEKYKPVLLSWSVKAKKEDWIQWDEFVSLEKWQTFDQSAFLIVVEAEGQLKTELLVPGAAVADKWQETKPVQNFPSAKKP